MSCLVFGHNFSNSGGSFLFQPVLCSTVEPASSLFVYLKDILLLIENSVKLQFITEGMYCPTECCLGTATLHYYRTLTTRQEVCVNTLVPGTWFWFRHIHGTYLSDLSVVTTDIYDFAPPWHQSLFLSTEVSVQIYDNTTVSCTTRHYGQSQSHCHWFLFVWTA